MEKILTGLVVGLVAAVLIPFIFLFVGVINGTILYFTWNILAPIYFFSFIPAQLIHVTWFHSFLFTYLLAILVGNRSSVSTSK